MSSGEEAEISYFATKLAVELQEDSTKSSDVYDCFLEKFGLEKDRKKLIEIAHDFCTSYPLNILKIKLKWLEEQRMKSNSKNFNKKDESSSLAGTASCAEFTNSEFLGTGDKSGPGQLSVMTLSALNLPFVDEDIESDRIVSNAAGTGDYVADKKVRVVEKIPAGMEETLDYQVRDSKVDHELDEDRRDIYNKKRGDPVAIEMSNLDFSSNTWGCGNQYKNYTAGEESGDSRLETATSTKKVKKKKKKKSDYVDDTSEINPTSNEKKESKSGVEMNAVSTKKRRRKKANHVNDKNNVDLEEADKNIDPSTSLVASTQTTVDESPKKKTKMTIQKYRETIKQQQSMYMHIGSTVRPVYLLNHEKNMEDVNRKKKEEKEKRQEEIKQQLSNENIAQILKSIEDTGDKKKSKETKVVSTAKPSKKKPKKVKKPSPSENAKKNFKATADDDKAVASNDKDKNPEEVPAFVQQAPVITAQVAAISDNDEEFANEFTIQHRRSRKTAAKNNTSSKSDRNSPDFAKRNKRRLSESSPKVDETSQHKPSSSSAAASSNQSHNNSTDAPSSSHHHHHHHRLPTSSNFTSAAAKSSKNSADLSNAKMWPTLESAAAAGTSCLPLTASGAAGGGGSSHQSSVSYASKLKTNLDSVGGSTASSGEDGNSSTSSSGGPIINNSNPNEFESSTSFRGNNANGDFAASASGNQESLWNDDTNSSVATVVANLVNQQPPPPAFQSSNEELTSTPVVSFEYSAENDDVSPGSSNVVTSCRKLEEKVAAAAESTENAAQNGDQVPSRSKATQQNRKVVTADHEEDEKEKLADIKDELKTSDVVASTEQSTPIHVDTESNKNTVDEIVENAWAFSFFYNESSGEASTEKSTSQVAERLTNPTATSHVNDGASKTEEKPLSSSNKKQCPKSSEQPRSNRRQIAPATSAIWRDSPGEFDVVAARKLLSKEFAKASKGAVVYSSQNPSI